MSLSSGGTNLKVDVSVGQPAGTSFIQEVDVFNEQAEERNHNLLLDAVCGLRPLGGAAESGAIVAEVAGRVHLVLNEKRTNEILLDIC